MIGITLLILFVMPTVLLFILFAELRVGKAGVKRLEEDVRSCRDGRRVCSLLAGMAAIRQPLWLTQRPCAVLSHSLLSDPL